MRDSFIKRLAELAANDERIMLVTGDLGFGVLDDFAERFPSQYINAGVAEQNMTGLATGLALEGRIVFTYSIANFPILRCLEQIRNDACYHDANVKIVSIGGGFSYGSLGFSHHATEDISILRAIPGTTVVVPGDVWEAAEATEALVKQPGTCYLRLDKSAAKCSNQPDEQFFLGKARLMRSGTDLTLIAAGGILEVVLNVADKLRSQGIRARVLNIHTIKPIDRDAIIQAAGETGGIVTVEEHVVDGGLGSAVGEVCLEDGTIPGFFYRVGLRDGFATVVGSQSHLRTKYRMDKESICQTVLELVSRGKKGPLRSASSAK